MRTLIVMVCVLATLVMGERSFAEDPPTFRELAPEHVFALSGLWGQIFERRTPFFLPLYDYERDLSADDAPFLVVESERESLQEHHAVVQEIARLLAIETPAVARKPDESVDTFYRRGKAYSWNYHRAVEALCARAEDLGRRGETEEAFQLLEPVLALVGRRGNFEDALYAEWCLNEFGEALSHVAQTVEWEPKQRRQLHAALCTARDDLDAIASQAVSVFVAYETERSIFGDFPEETDREGKPMPAPEERMRRIEQLLADVLVFFPDPEAGEQIEPLGSEIQYLMAPFMHPDYNLVLEMFTRHHQVRSALNAAIAATAPAP